MRILQFMSTSIFCVTLAGNLFAAESVTKSSGGSIKTHLSGSVVVNEGSTLQREWITVHDDSMLASVARGSETVGTVGVRTVYRERGSYSSGGYRYVSAYVITATEALSAIEVRFLLFDVWGNHSRNLSSTDVIDMKAGEVESFHPEWNVHSENEVSEFYASIAYIAQVRTKDGRVIKADPNFILKQAQQFSDKFSVEDLEPTPVKP